MQRSCDGVSAPPGETGISRGTTEGRDLLSRDLVGVVSVLWVSPQEILDLKVLIPAAAGPTAWSQESAGRKILIPVAGVRKAVNWVVSVLRVWHRTVFGLGGLFPEGLNQQARVRLVGRWRVLGRRILILKRVC
jgi:hypothetical protein